MNGKGRLLKRKKTRERIELYTCCLNGIIFRRINENHVKIIILTLIFRLVGLRLVFKQPHMFGHLYHVIFLLLVSFLFLHIFSANKQTTQRNKREREKLYYHIIT